MCRLGGWRSRFGELCSYIIVGLPLGSMLSSLFVEINKIVISRATGKSLCVQVTNYDKLPFIRSVPELIHVI